MQDLHLHGVYKATLKSAPLLAQLADARILRLLRIQLPRAVTKATRQRVCHLSSRTESSFHIVSGFATSTERVKLLTHAIPACVLAEAVLPATYPWLSIGSEL